MPLHQSILPHRRQAIVFNSTSLPSQFKCVLPLKNGTFWTICSRLDNSYIFGIAVELASRKTFSEVDIYFMTDECAPFNTFILALRPP